MTSDFSIGMFDSSDPEQVSEREESAATREAALLRVGLLLLSDYEGRRWLWEKMALCGTLRHPVVEGDTHATYFNLGMANVGRVLLDEAMHYPDLYCMMIKEAQERSARGL